MVNTIESPELRKARQRALRHSMKWGKRDQTWFVVFDLDYEVYRVVCERSYDEGLMTEHWDEAVYAVENGYLVD